MSKKITLTVNGTRFDIDLEDGFAEYVEAEIAENFNVEGNNDIRRLLQAYIKKNHEVYEAEKMLDNTIKKL